MTAPDCNLDSPACRLLQLPDNAVAVLLSLLTDVLDRAALRSTCRCSLQLVTSPGTSLDLSTRPNAIALLKRCPGGLACQITHLRLQFCAESAKNGAALISPLARLTSLIDLDVSGCYDLLPDNLLEGLRSHNLRAAKFYWCPNINDDFIQGLVTSSRSLRYLNLSGAKHLTNYAICEIATHLHHLRYLDCTKLVDLTDRALIALSQSRAAPVLETLILYACPNFTNLGLRILVKGCRSLRHIDICGSLHITDQGIEYLAKGSRHLERLNITWCTLLTDRSLAALARYCPNLTRLEARGVKAISDEGIKILSRNGRNRIRELDVIGCVGVTDWTRTNLKQLFPMLPSLTKC